MVIVYVQYNDKNQESEISTQIILFKKSVNKKGDQKKILTVPGIS